MRRPRIICMVNGDDYFYIVTQRGVTRHRAAVAYTSSFEDGTQQMTRDEAAGTILLYRQYRHKGWNIIVERV